MGTDVEQERFKATQELRMAGRERVREVCKPNLEHLDPSLWASDNELLVSRQLIISYVGHGGLNAIVFKDLGLGSHADALARRREAATDEPLSLLRAEARKRLFTGVSEDIRKEMGKSYWLPKIDLNKT